MTDAPKIAVIGCGHWGKNLVRNFHDLDALAAICEHDPTLGAAMAEQYGVPLRPMTDVLADTAIKAVVIAAPAELHTLLVNEALLANKHVFVEKPLSLTAEDGQSSLSSNTAIPFSPITTSRCSLKG